MERNVSAMVSSKRCSGENVGSERERAGVVCSDGIAVVGCTGDVVVRTKENKLWCEVIGWWYIAVGVVGLLVVVVVVSVFGFVVVLLGAMLVVWLVVLLPSI